MTQTEKLLAITSQQLRQMDDIELSKLLKQSQKNISTKLRAIEKAGFTPLVENIKELKAPVTTNRKAMERQLRTYKTFLRSETSSVTSIRKALKEGYKSAKSTLGDFGQLSEETKVVSPSSVIHKKVTTKTGRVYDRFYTKSGQRVIQRHTLTGDVVYVPVGTKDPALMTQSVFKKQMEAFSKVRQTKEIQEANIPSNHLGILLWHARKGRIKVGKTKIGSGKSSPEISTATNIASAIVEVYENWEKWPQLSQTEREDALRLADAAVYRDLDMAD